MTFSPSPVVAHPAAMPEDVISIYSAKLAMETDCADVYATLSAA